MEACYKLDLPVVSHCEDLDIIAGGIINKGAVSEALGVKGMDRTSEDTITAREVTLAESTGTRIHICHEMCIRDSFETYSILVYVWICLAILYKVHAVFTASGAVFKMFPLKTM